MGTPGGFNIDDLVGDLNQDLAARLDNELGNSQEQEQANVGELNADQTGLLEQNTVTDTTTVGGAGGDGGTAIGGDSTAVGGRGEIDQDGKVNLNFGDAGGDAVSGDGGDASADGGAGGAATSVVDVDAEADQDQALDQDLDQDNDADADNDQDIDEDLDLDADIEDVLDA
jgi:hypothetical protein